MTYCYIIERLSHRPPVVEAFAGTGGAALFLELEQVGLNLAGGGAA